MPWRTHVRLSARTGDCRGSAGGQGAADIRMGRSKAKVGWGARPRAGLGVREHRAGRHVKPWPFVQPVEGGGGSGGIERQKEMGALIALPLRAECISHNDPLCMR